MEKLHSDIVRFLENEHNNMWTGGDRQLWKRYIGMVFTIQPPPGTASTSAVDQGNVEAVVEATCDPKHATRLEGKRVLNWVSPAQCDTMVALAVRSDGNCLVHAACAAMWGVQDAQFDVRRMLFHSMLKDDRYMERPSASSLFLPSLDPCQIAYSRTRCSLV